MGKPIDFILIDDDPVNNFLSEIIIGNVFPDARISAFTDPRKGLDHILNIPYTQSREMPVLLLDLTMPHMTGWEFLQHFEDADLPGKEQLQIYILSSSVNPADKEKARQNAFVKAFLEKPLSEEILSELFAA